MGQVVRKACTDMVSLADGLADLNDVVEGTRLEMGMDGAPIAAEVHRANMEKANMTPPDIVGELVKQGWVSNEVGP